MPLQTLIGTAYGSSTTGAVIERGRLFVAYIISTGDIDDTGSWQVGQPNPPNNYWTKIDDAGDEDTSYIVETSSGGHENIWFERSATDIPANSRIVGVATLCQVKASRPNSHCHARLKINGTWYETSLHALPEDVWGIIACRWFDNPDDSAAWEVDDINSDIEEIGYGGYTLGGTARVSSMRTVVEYFDDNVYLAGTSGGSSIAASSFSYTAVLPGVTNGTSLAGAILESRTELLGASAGNSIAGGIINNTATLVGVAGGVGITANSPIKLTMTLGGASAGTSTVGAFVLCVTRNFAGVTNGIAIVTVGLKKNVAIRAPPIIGLSVAVAALIETPYRQRGCLWPDRTLRGTITVVKRPL